MGKSTDTKAKKQITKPDSVKVNFKKVTKKNTPNTEYRSILTSFPNENPTSLLRLRIYYAESSNL